MKDTIFALASARGRAGVAIVRVSGPDAFAACVALCGALPPPRMATLRNISWHGEIIDQAIVVCFAKGASFTGEECVEFQVHGSPAVVSSLLAALADQPNLRAAEAGEFTRRALENGQLDLAQVEGLADLIEAETEAQRKHALSLMTGRLQGLADAWRASLIRAAALLEATIDFADEDVPVNVVPEVQALIGPVLSALRQEVAGFGVAERLRDGFEVALIGRPNAGKSTLLNALAGRDAAITSTVAGTTRDIIEVRLAIRGLPVTVLDTAGLRETEDEVEQIGISRTVERATRADLRIFLMDEGEDVPLVSRKAGDLVVHGKADLHSKEGLSVSGKTGEGVARLVEEIGRVLETRTASASTINRTRHLECVNRAIRALEFALLEVDAGSDRVDLAAEQLRRAIRALDSLIGRVDVEDLLDEIFSSFCIGK